MAARVWRLLTLTWAVIIAVLTLLPGDRLPPTPHWELLSFDTASHAAVFLALALPLGKWWRAEKRRRSFWAPVGWAIAYGALIEVLQTVMPFGRHGEWSDLLSDGLGALAGAGLAAIRSPRGMLLFFFLLFSAGNMQAQSFSDRAADTAQAGAYHYRALSDIGPLCDGYHAGRGYGYGDGARKAAKLLARRLNELGLEPLGDSVGSYYQHFTLPVNTFLAHPQSLGPSLSLDINETAQSGPEIDVPVIGYGFILAPDCPTTSLHYKKVVSFDTTLFTLLPDSAAVWSRLRCQRLKGKVIVMRAEDERKLPLLPHKARIRLAMAAAVLVREPTKLTASIATSQAHQPRAHLLESVWNPHTTSVSLVTTTHFTPAYPAMNLLARRRGTAHSDTVLFVTAHYDHLGQQGPVVTFPGANDNASGTAMLLDLADALRDLRHDVIFCLFSAEEAGLLGSTFSATHPPVPLGRIRFLLNLDLMGHGDQGLGVVNATLHPARFRLLDSLNTALGPARLPALKKRGRAANSDHFPFSERGVPAFFTYSLGGPGFYHDVQDKPAALNLRAAWPVRVLLEAFVRAVDQK